MAFRLHQYLKLFHFWHQYSVAFILGYLKFGNQILFILEQHLRSDKELTEDEHLLLFTFEVMFEVAMRKRQVANQH